MKRWWTVALSLGLAAGLAGCTSAEGSTQVQAPVQTIQQTQTPAPTQAPTSSPTPVQGASPTQETHADAFAGQWQDSVSQRAGMEITFEDGTYEIEINWGSSARENTRWNFQGTYDEKRGGIAYTSGQRVEETYPEAGARRMQIVYQDGTGLFKLKEGKLYWQDEKENAGAESVFVKVPES